MGNWFCYKQHGFQVIILTHYNYDTKLGWKLVKEIAQIYTKNSRETSAGDLNQKVYLLMDKYNDKTSFDELRNWSQSSNNGLVVDMGGGVGKNKGWASE